MIKNKVSSNDFEEIKKRSQADVLNDLFETQIKAINLPYKYVREYIACPPRQFRWDYAFIEKKILIEINGGTWGRKRTGHTSGVGVRRDYEKNNVAVSHGWTVYYFTSDWVYKGIAINILEQVICGKPISSCS